MNDLIITFLSQFTITANFKKHLTNGKFIYAKLVNLYIAFAMEYVSGEPIPDGDEVDEAGFFTLEETGAMHVASFTKWLLDVAFQINDNGLIKEPLPIRALEKYGLFRV